MFLTAMGLRYGFEGPIALWDYVGLEIPSVSEMADEYFVLSRAYFTATTSISTFAALGSLATSNAARAG